MSNAGGSKGDALSDDWEEFWSDLPEKALYPLCVPIVEALWWVGEPLSAVGLVDVFDGFLDMWETAHHLHVLEELDVVESLPYSPTRNDLLDLPYRLKDRDSA